MARKSMNLEEKKNIMIEVEPNKRWIRIALYRDKKDGAFALDIRNFVEAKDYIGLTSRGVRFPSDYIGALIEGVQACNQIVETESKKPQTFYGRGKE